MIELSPLELRQNLQDLILIKKNQLEEIINIFKDKVSKLQKEIDIDFDQRIFDLTSEIRSKEKILERNLRKSEEIKKEKKKFLASITNFKNNFDTFQCISKQSNALDNQNQSLEFESLMNSLSKGFGHENETVYISEIKKFLSKTNEKKYNADITLAKRIEIYLNIKKDIKAKIEELTKNMLKLNNSKNAEVRKKIKQQLNKNYLQHQMLIEQNVNKHFDQKKIGLKNLIENNRIKLEKIAAKITTLINIVNSILNSIEREKTKYIHKINNENKQLTKFSKYSEGNISNIIETKFVQIESEIKNILNRKISALSFKIKQKEKKLNYLTNKISLNSSIINTINAKLQDLLSEYQDIFTQYIRECKEQSQRLYNKNEGTLENSEIIQNQRYDKNIDRRFKNKFTIKLLEIELKISTEKKNFKNIFEPLNLWKKKINKIKDDIIYLKFEKEMLVNENKKENNKETKQIDKTSCLYKVKNTNNNFTVNINSELCSLESNIKTEKLRLQELARKIRYLEFKKRRLNDLIKLLASELNYINKIEQKVKMVKINDLKMIYKKNNELPFEVENIINKEIKNQFKNEFNILKSRILNFKNYHNQLNLIILTLIHNREKFVQKIEIIQKDLTEIFNNRILLKIIESNLKTGNRIREFIDLIKKTANLDSKIIFSEKYINSLKESYRKLLDEKNRESKIRIENVYEKFEGKLTKLLKEVDVLNKDLNLLESSFNSE